MLSSLRASLLRSLVPSLLLIIAALVIAAKINATRSFASPDSLPPSSPCVVRIEGAVAKPGLYRVTPGTLLQKVLAKSRPKPFADLRGIDPSFRVEDPTELVIQELTHLEIEVTGPGVEPTYLLVPVGTRPCDLPAQLTLHPDADRSIFRGRRLLKNGEVLTVLKTHLKKGIDEKEQVIYDP